MGATSGSPGGDRGPASILFPAATGFACFRQARSAASAGSSRAFWVRGPGKRSTGHAWYFVTIQNIEGGPSRQGVNGSPEMGFGLFAALAAIGPAMERTASMSGVAMATGLPIPGACLGACLVPAIAGLRQPAGMVRKRARSSPRKGTVGNAPFFGEGAYVPWQSHFSQRLAQMSAGAVLLEVAKDERREQICACRLQGPVAPGFELWDCP